MAVWRVELPGIVVNVVERDGKVVKIITPADQLVGRTMKDVCEWAIARGGGLT